MRSTLKEKQVKYVEVKRRIRHGLMRKVLLFVDFGGGVGVRL